MQAPITIRPARLEVDELVRLQEIEVRAGTLFAEISMPEIAEDDPPTLDELRDAAAILVAVGDDGHVVGYARIELVDGQAHLEQLSVDPDHGRQGIGADLLDAVADWARNRGDRELTLTTFRDVPFNAPYYRRQGFEIVPGDERSLGLVELMSAEAAHGLDPDQRVAMRRRLDGG